MDNETLSTFNYCWDELATLGEVDGWGGSEYRTTITACIIFLNTTDEIISDEQMFSFIRTGDVN